MKRFLLLAALLAEPVHAATLRPYVAIDDPMVRLSDLFSGVETDRVLGTAPVPGSRIIVEAPQLAAIARQFGVDWRPGSASDRVTLERTGRAMSPGEVQDLLRPALLAAGAPASGQMDLPGLQPPIVAPLGTPRIARLDYDAPTGRFTATLSVQQGDTEPVVTQIQGRMEETAEIAVPSRRILAGEPIGPGDLHLQRVRAASLATEVLRDPAQGLGLASRRVLTAGQPVPMRDLARAVVVQKGALILLALDSPGITLTAQGVAEESGGVGDRIRVTNPASKAVVLADITGPGRARVIPGSAPLSPAGRQLAAR